MILIDGYRWVWFNILVVHDVVLEGIQGNFKSPGQIRSTLKEPVSVINTEHVFLLCFLYLVQIGKHSKSPARAEHRHKPTPLSFLKVVFQAADGKRAVD